jgi:signal peptidase I
LATTDTTVTDPPAASNSKLIRTLLEIAVLVLAVVLALLIRLTIFEAALVTSGSMQHTLEKDDRVLIDHRLALHNNWQRGEIVIFDTPPSWGDEKETLIKRVIGLPGETLEISDGKVYVGGKILDEPYINSDSEARGDTAKIVLLSNEYFMIGDNRNNSEDSRDLGPVEEKFIRGRAVWVLAPLGRFGKLTRPTY